ncbi:MAG TPA: rhomboid family intramembrane serine protease [Beijerinckiaceae bacterium]
MPSSASANVAAMDGPSTTPAPREPAINLPGVILACLALLVGLHLVRGFLSPETDVALLFDFALVPARWTVSQDPLALRAVMAEAGAGPEAETRLALARYVLGEPDARPWTFLTYGLLHGSWTHVILNGLWLAAFGAPVARRCGAARFGLVLALGVAAGGATHVALHSLSVSPLVGASAAVSALMAAASRFVFTPVPTFFGLEPRPVHERPRQSLRALASNRSAVLFLLVWFCSNLLFGLSAQPLGLSDAAIAWEAHLGGFVVGFFLFPLIDTGRAAGQGQPA